MSLREYGIQNLIRNFPGCGPTIFIKYKYDFKCMTMYSETGIKESALCGVKQWAIRGGVIIHPVFIRNDLCAMYNGVEALFLF